MREYAEGRGTSRKSRARLDGLRPVLGAAFLAPSPVATTVFLATGIVLYAMSVPWASAFHKGLALVSFAALGAVLVTGRFDAGAFVGELGDR